MVYAEGQNAASVGELARQGNLQAISYWLNSRLAVYRLFARIDQVRSGSLRVVVELRPATRHKANTVAFRNKLVRFVCHQLWKLNSPHIEGAIVAARYVGQSKLLWKQSVRIVSPARRAQIANSPQAVRRRVRQVTRKRKQFQAMRSVLISGSSVAAFIFGCWLGYADAPSEQTQASAVMSQLNRGDSKVQAALETVPVQQPREVSHSEEINLMFAGDVSFGANYDRTVGNNHRWSLSDMADLRQADISMVNLDTPLTNENQLLPGKTDNLKAVPDRVDVLRSGGVDLVNLANNNAMDYQANGLGDTLETLQKAGIAAVGAGANATAARRPVIMEVKGQRIAYLSYYDSDLNAATDQTAGINPRRNDRIAADIKSIRDQVNWVVVNYHWGEEMAKYPGDWQIDLARFTVDQGADLVVGHHPKILQGAEIYKGRPIAYSLGNFIFSGKTPEQSTSDYDTAVLKVGIKDQKMRVEFLPVEVRNFQARVVKGDRGTAILNQIQDVSDIFESPLTGPMILDAESNQARPAEDPSASKNQTAPTDESGAPSEAEQSEAPQFEPKPFQSTGDRPWNENTFTAPGDNQSDQQGSAVTEDSPQQLERPIEQVQPAPNHLPQFKDTIESPKRRYAKATDG